MAGVSLSQGQVQISRQAQRVREVKCKVCRLKLTPTYWHMSHVMRVRSFLSRVVPWNSANKSFFPDPAFPDPSASCQLSSLEAMIPTRAMILTRTPRPPFSGLPSLSALARRRSASPGSAALGRAAHLRCQLAMKKTLLVLFLGVFQSQLGSLSLTYFLGPGGDFDIGEIIDMGHLDLRILGSPCPEFLPFVGPGLRPGTLLFHWPQESMS